MSTWGDQLGRWSTSRNAGVGAQIAPEQVPKTQKIVYGNFSGIDQSASPTIVPFSAGIRRSIDIEVTKDNALIRAPGIVLIEDAPGHSFKYAVSQTAPDGSVELLVFDPPYIGVRAAAATAWTNVALPATGPYGWVAANHGGIEVFSNALLNGYARLFGAAAIISVPTMPAGRSIASIFARVFIAGPLVGGSYDNLRIAWSGASGAYNDWSSLTASSEALVADLSWADRIVALRPHGRDLLCILMRHSVWIGVPTGDAARPADFRIVFAGVGCVSESTARTTRDGVTYLSDDGVHTFDGNNDEMISGAINEELLPVDYDQLGRYTASYDSYRKRYLLTTPFGVWVHEYAVPELQRPARWYKRSFIADSVFSYSDQAADPVWDDATDTWDTTGEGTWDEDIAIGLDAPTRLFFASGTKLGREDYSNFQNFGVDFTGKWRGTPPKRDDLSGLIMVQEYELEYKSGGRVLISTPDTDGNMTPHITAILPNQGDDYSSESIEHTAEGLPGLEIDLLPPAAGDILVSDLVVMPGETVTLISPSETPTDIVSEVLGDGVLITIDNAGPFISPVISRIGITFVPTGPKMTSNIQVQ